MITITGTFESLIGSTTGSVAFELANFGTDVPRVSGTGVLTSIKTTSAVGNTFSVTLFANNTITPSNTYYIVTFFDANGNVASQAPYTLNTTADISTLSPIAALPTVNQNAILANPNAQQTISTWQLNVVSLGILGGSSGTTQLLAAATAGGAWTFRNTTDNVVGQATTDTLTNKTLTSPTVNSPTINTPTLNGSGGQLTLPAGPDTLVARATTDTLTNKTLSSPTINTPTLNGSGGQLSLPAGPDTLVARATTDTLTNKTLTGSAGMANNITVLKVVGQQANQTGNGANQNITNFTFTIPANMLTAATAIRIWWAITHSTGSATVTYTLSMGDVANQTLLGNTGFLASGHVYITKGTTGNPNVYVAFASATGNGATNGIGLNAFATSTTLVSQNCTVTLGFNVANTDAITPQQFIIELLQ